MSRALSDIEKADIELDSCGCCEPADPPPVIHNEPGLPALQYRVGSHTQFLERMLRALPSARPGVDSQNQRPLQTLTVRSSDDPTVALLDAFANVADVLTFYQERIANEGYLRTATERRSVLELARAIGYELSPGVAASVYLSFTVEDAVGAPRQCLIPQGTQIQSVPPQGKAPQVFETSADFQAFAEWNALRPRLTRPADMAVLSEGSNRKLVLLVPAGSVPPGPAVTQNVDVSQVQRLESTQPAAGALDAVEVERVYFTEAAAGLTKGELLLFAGGESGQRVTVLRRVVEVVPEPDRKRIRVDIAPLAAPPAGLKIIPYVLHPFVSFATVALSPLGFSGSSVSTHVVGKVWRERDLTALIGIQGWDRIRLTRAVNSPPASQPAPPSSGAFAFQQKLGFFGHNAPKWSSLPKNTTTNGTPYALPWDPGDGSTAPSTQRSIWESSQGTDHASGGPHAFLERTLTGLAPGSWMVIESPSQGAKTWSLHHTQDESKADYGLSGKSTGLTLGSPTTGQALTQLPTDAFGFRESTAHVDSRRLVLAELPVETPIDEGTTAVELERMVLGLQSGQPLVLTGERQDTPGVDAAEVVFLSEAVHVSGKTTLLLRSPLRYSYVREKLSISANVVHATHGETVREVLGSGDASLRNQRFWLSKPPLTYVSAPTPRGAETTLDVRVNDVLWEEVPSLYQVEANRQAYIVRIDDNARPSITFGDAHFGARLLTGMANVTASYRSGIGPDGEVTAGSLTLLRTMPMGLRGVTNALPASGAEAPETLALARDNAPLTVLTFERVVSLPDFEDFARTFPGIGKALADVLTMDGNAVIHLTVAGATGGAPGEDTLKNLIAAIGAASDSSQRFIVSPFTQRYFTCRARVVIDPRYRKDLVLSQVAEHIRQAFSFEARHFGQSVTAAEVVRVIHEVAGVVAVDLDVLAAYSEDIDVSASAAGTQPVVAHRARWQSAASQVEPAELLLINPVGIELEELLP